jgi:hypothetical protein
MRDLLTYTVAGFFTAGAFLYIGYGWFISTRIQQEEWYPKYFRENIYRYKKHFARAMIIAGAEVILFVALAILTRKPH